MRTPRMEAPQSRGWPELLGLAPPRAFRRCYWRKPHQDNGSIKLAESPKRTIHSLAEPRPIPRRAAIAPSEPLIRVRNRLWP
jgi:hypothetical protein